MKCYTYNGNSGLHYQEIFKQLLDELENGGFSDIVYSVELNEEGEELTLLQKTLKSSFNSIKVKNKVEINKIYVSYGNDGDPISTVNANNLHLTTLIDDNRFKDPNGNLYSPKISEEDFIKNYALILRTKNPDLSEEAALALSKAEFKSYAKKKFDAYIIHAVCRRYFSEITKEDIKNVINDLKATNSSNGNFVERANYILKNDNLLNQLKEVYQQMRKIDIQKGSVVLYDIPIQKEIILDGTKVKVYDTIDKVIIRKDGHVDIVKYKITEDNPTSWPSKENDSKTDKYRFELAFIKSMLEDQGIHFNNKVNLHIAAIQLDYDHSNPENVMINNINTKPFNLQMDIVDGQYKMAKHTTVARNIIQPDINFDDCSKAVEQVNKELNLIFPEKGIQLKSQMISVEQYIKDNPDRIIKVPQIPGGDNKYKYELFLGSEHILITEDNPPESNAEIHQKISEFLDSKSDSNQIIVNSLQSAVEQAIIDGYMKESNLSAFRRQAPNICDMLNPYVAKHKNNNGEWESDWKYVKNSELAAYNILIFQNNTTKQLDIINITNLNLSSKIRFNKGKNLAGHYLMDLDARLPDATHSLIQGIEVISLLNQLISTIEKPKLGTMKIISTFESASSENYNIETFINKIYKPLIGIVNNNVQEEDKIKYKLSNSDFIDEYQTIYDELKNILDKDLSYYWDDEVKENFNIKASEILGSYSLDEEKRLSQMESLLHVFETTYGSNSVEEIETKLKSSTGNIKLLTLIKSIYDYVSKVKGREVSFGENIDSFLKTFAKPGNIKSHNFRVTINNWNEYSTRINDRAYKVGKEIDQLVTEYYKNAGYSNLQNGVVGNQMTQFNHLFEEGNLMKFKNPYDDRNDLLNYERDFLKKALLIFARYRNSLFTTITDPNSKECLELIEKNSIWYFNCPLQKSSGASALQSGYKFQQISERVKTMMKDPKLWLAEKLDKAAVEDYFKENLAKTDVTKMSVNNYFHYGEATNSSNETCNSVERQKLLKNHENVNYFEHNVENLLRDFTFEAIRVENIKSFVFDTKLQLLVLNLKGSEQHNPEQFQDEIGIIKEFLKINVFRVPTMSNVEQKLATVVLPLKKLITNLFIPGNIAGTARDINEGFLQGMCRSITKVGTDITPADVIAAYAIVTKDTITNPKMASLVHQLCIKYMLSNIDNSNVAEGQKTGNRGIINFDEFMYQTVKRPDFLNRMVLFVAKCRHDGCWDALSVDEYGNIQYDWKKDKRFNLLVNDDKSNIDAYNKQKSLYFSLIRQWNYDHPDFQVEYTDLPMPYSEREVRMNKDFADNIYGSYDRATKSMGEQSLLMMTFGNFTTWMNGQVESYYKQAGPDKSKFTWEQATDNSGNPLFFTETGGLTTEDTGYICYNQIPIWTQGIIQTLTQMGRAIFKGENTIKDVMSNKENQKNINKLISDIGMTLLYYLFIKVLLQALRKEQKEETDDSDFLTNAICEIMYKGLYNSWDGFKGPLNVFQYLGEQTNPPIYTEGIAVTKDLFRMVSGNMNIVQFGSRHVAPLRSVRETVKDYYKANK